MGEISAFQREPSGIGMGTSDSLGSLGAVQSPGMRAGGPQAEDGMLCGEVSAQLTEDFLVMLLNLE